MEKKNTARRISVLAMFAAISVVLVAFVHFPLIPSAPFLEYDMADIPIIIATLLFGVVPGLAVLLVTSVVQAFAFGGNGIIGLVMHFIASGAMVVIIGLICKNDKSYKKLIPAMVLGCLAMVAIMIPMNLILTPMFMGAPVEAVKQMLLPAIIPFNAIKSVLNCIISALLYKLLLPVFRGMNLVKTLDK